MLALTLVAVLLQPPAPAGEAEPPPPAAAPPAVVVLALDTSGSVPAGVLAGARILAGEVLASLPRGSQVAVYTFDDASRLVLERTADLERVEAAIDAAESAGSFTALHDALFDASRYLMDAPPTRRAIVLLTDGRDENSALLLEDGLALATENGIPVFCVGIGRDVEEQVLRRVARLTGGDYARMAGASGHALAAAIRSLALPEPPARPTPRAPPPPEPEPGGGWQTLWIGTLASLVVLALLGAGVVAVLAARRRGTRPRPALTPEGTGPPGLPATIVGRTADTSDVPRTVLLQPRAALRIVSGPGRGREIRLDPEQAMSMGRSRVNELVLEDESISGEHCRVRHESEGWVLHDLGSTNGTRVNERRVDRHTLKGGDLISLGETSLQFLER